MSLSAAVGAPAPVTLAGSQYVASPVDLFGLGELEEYARARILSISAKAAEGVPPALGDRILDRAIKTATALDFESEEFQKYLMSERGMQTMLSIALRPRHPGMTPTAVATLMKGRGAEVVAAVATVLRISGLDGDGEKGGQQPGEGGPGGEAAA